MNNQWWETVGQWQQLLVDDPDYEKWAKALDEQDIQHQELIYVKYEDMGCGETTAKGCPETNTSRKVEEQDRYKPSVEDAGSH